MAENRVRYRDRQWIFRLLWLILVILTAGYLSFLYKPYIFIPEQVRYLNTALHLRFKPSGTVGHALGVVGTIFMLLSYTLYVLRKRVECFEFLGPLSLWLEIHVFFGILGPVLIVFHSAFALKGIVGVAFWLMIVVVISGVFGRFLAGYCFWGISSIYEPLHEIDLLIERDLRNASRISPVIERIMDLKPPGFPCSSGLVETIRQWRSIKKETGSLLDLINEKYDDDQQGELHKWADQLIKRLRDIRSIAVLDVCLCVLNKWEIIHKVSSYLLFFITLAHVLVTSYWGYRWIF
ncbi:MAG: hypothetical protein AB1847_16945 [bacterium]